MRSPLRNYPDLLRAGLLSVVIAALIVLVGCSSSESAAEGETAPDFTLPAAGGANVSLSGLLTDREAAVLIFYRGFF